MKISTRSSAAAAFTLPATLLFAIVLSGCSMQKTADKASEPQMPRGAMASVDSVTATIKDINYDTRMVTLETDKGETATLHVGEEARNFNQAHTGDKVKIDYLEAVAIDVQRDSGELSTGVESTLERTPAGEKPGGLMTNTVRVKALVEAIDYASRSITLKGSEGNIVTMKVGEAAKRFNEIKVGDTVAIVYAEALAIAVTKSN